MNLTGDWKVWDNLEQVTLVTERGTTDYVQTPVTAKRRALTFRELVGSGGVYTAGDLVWLVPAELVPDGDRIPKVSDRLQDTGGDEWTVLEAGLNTWRTWWRLVTRNLILAHDLRELIGLYQPDAKQDAAGGRVPGYSAVMTDLPARIQEVEVAAETERLGKRQAVKRYTAWVGRRVRPAANWRVVDSAGQKYSILGWRAADRLDVLQELDLEVVA